MVLVRSRESSTTQTDSENSLSPLGHFTEHLVGAFEKLHPENNLDHEPSSLSIRWLNSAPVIQPATNHNWHEQQSPTAIHNQKNVLSKIKPATVL
jgi:hypothetical protein